MNQFAEMLLHPALVQAVEALGYQEPTPIQKAVIPLMLAGQDVMGQAQTGTGKTAAFALPILDQLDPNVRHVQALVLAPTRELASQVAEAFERYGQFKNVRTVAIYGGQSYDRQIRQLKRGVDVVVGTPGRLLDLIGQKKLDLSQVHTVVLDEADEMLSMGFIEDIEQIWSEIPAERHSALFSATMPKEIRRLAMTYMNQPETVVIEAKQLTVEAIDQRVYIVNEDEKLAAMTRLFETENITSALIFTRTRLETGRVANELTTRGFAAEALSGDLTQKAREHVMERFTNQKIKVLVATDIAARGLDIDHISHVFNFDVPQFPEVYVHRVGRTGRAGKSGVAITLISPRERYRLRKIEGYTRQKLPIVKLPTEADVWAIRDERLMERVMVWLRRDRYKKEKDMINALVEEGFEPLDLAAASLKLARSQERTRPIEKVREVDFDTDRRRGRDDRRGRDRRFGRGQDERRGRSPRRERSHRNGRRRVYEEEPGMVRFKINVGRVDGVRPGDVVREVAVTSGIKGSLLGAIIIEREHTMFDVPEEVMNRVLNPKKKIEFWERPVVVERV